MDWLTKLPVIGPLAAWFFRRRVWRVYRHLDDRKWNRLAAFITFSSFLALFPMLALTAAVGAALLSPARMLSVQHWLAGQAPGISDQLDLHSLVDNAGTVGLVSGVLLLVTGVNWAASLRESVRCVWDLEENPGNPVLLKLKDLGTLVGLGVVGLVSLAGSAFAVAAVGWVAGLMGLVEGGIGTVLLRAAGYTAAVAADFVLLWYLLTVLPGVRPPRRAVVVAGLLGAVGFELLKLLLSGYLSGVAAKSMYGTFGVPVALLLWMSFMAKLMLFCAGWTATQRTEKPLELIDTLGSGDPEPVETERAAPAPVAGDEGEDEGGSGDEDGSGNGDGDGSGNGNGNGDGSGDGDEAGESDGHRARDRESRGVGRGRCAPST